MVRISKRKLPAETLSKLLLLFFEVIGKKNDRDEFIRVIDDLFSETEQVMIIKRISIIYLLLKKIDNTMIADVLKVSTGTIWKYAYLTKHQNQGLVMIINRVLEKEKIRDFFDNIFYELFARPGKYGTNWKSGWYHKIEREAKKQTGL